MEASKIFGDLKTCKSCSKFFDQGLHIEFEQACSTNTLLWFNTNAITYKHCMNIHMKLEKNNFDFKNYKIWLKSYNKKVKDKKENDLKAFEDIMYCLNCSVKEGDAFEMARQYVRANNFISSSKRNKLKDQLKLFNFNINNNGCSQIIEQLKHMHQIVDQGLM